MTDYKNIDDKIQKGYELILERNVTAGCDSWLSAWEGIKQLMSENKLCFLTELQDKFRWSDFLLNFVQDMESELHNAGLSNKEYYHKRIKYCEELLEFCKKDNLSIISNTRRGIADSYFELGETDKCDELYSLWINENPDWGWGYIGWSACYWFKRNKNSSYINRATEILEKALPRKNVTERMEILKRLIELYIDAGRHLEANELKKDYKDTSLSLRMANNTATVYSEKIGRNDPCPCGSGKKHKKCCGK